METVRIRQFLCSGFHFSLPHNIGHANEDGSACDSSNAYQRLVSAGPDPEAVFHKGICHRRSCSSSSEQCLCLISQIPSDAREERNHA